MSCGRSAFPDPRAAPVNGPLAVGADLRPDTLLDAYRHGIFPWPTGESPDDLWWWSPDPRAVFCGQWVRVSRTLRRTMASGRFRVTLDEAFESVVERCAQRPRELTWITPAMAAAYTALHHRGFAHSVEVWDDAGSMVGGVYGVAVGAVFCGESMFHRVTDASKVALVALCEHLRSRGFCLLDAQMPTAHLSSLGAVLMSRETYLDTLGRAVDAPVRW